MIASDLHKIMKERSQRGLKTNFLFRGGGISHITSFNAYIEYVKDMGLDMEGIVIDSTPPEFSHQFHKDALVSLPHDKLTFIKEKQFGDTALERSMKKGIVARIRENERLIAKLREGAPKGDSGLTKEPFFFLQAFLGEYPKYIIDFLMELDRPIILVELDEGTGPHAASAQDYQEIGARREASRLKRTLKLLNLKIRRPWTDRRYEAFRNYVSLRPFTIFSKQDKEITLNNVAVKYHRNAYIELAQRSLTPCLDFSNTVIVATTKFEVYHAEEFEMEALRCLIGILHDIGYEVMIRPHPGTKDISRYEQLHVPIDRIRSVNLESIIAASSAKPEAIVGFMSSSQVICNAIWGIPAISIYKLLAKELKRIALVNPSIQEFIKPSDNSTWLFKDYVYSPESWEELDDTLRLRNERADN